MERLDNELYALQFLKEEHQQRYQYAARYAKGVVVDCACGIGYAAPLLLANQAVTDYVGIDMNKEAIELANEKNVPRATFSVGSILAMPFAENSVDTFISLETLEHLNDPQSAVDEISRIIKPDGIFICSVPTQCYEEYCIELYGPNPHHQQSFSYDRFKSILEKRFDYVDIAVISQEVVSVVHVFNSEKDRAELINPNEKNYFNGSFIALCTNHQPVSHDAVIFTGISRIDYDKEMLMPLRASLASAEKMALERWQALTESAQRNEEIIRYKEQAERIAAERLEAFTNTERILNERDKQLAEASRIIHLMQEQIKELSQKKEC